MAVEKMHAFWRKVGRHSTMRLPPTVRLSRSMLGSRENSLDLAPLWKKCMHNEIGNRRLGKKKKKKIQNRFVLRNQHNADKRT